MVAKVISGHHIKGALYYNEHKVAAGTAQCIQASGFLQDAGKLSFRDKLNRFTNLNQRNLRTKTNTLHISLNFDPGEKLSIDELNKIASVYMERIGFGDQPYLVYQHHDAAHPHIHIVSTLIQENAKRIAIHNLGRNQSETARQKIEIEFGLVRASSRQQKNSPLQPIEVEKAIYGKSLTKQSISGIVRTITRHYHYTTLPELNAILRQFNVIADRGTERSRMFEKNGLVYSLIDHNGRRIGIPVKASAIYGKPTLAFLNKQFKLNEVLRQVHREPLKQKIEHTLQDNRVRTRDDFITHLHGQGIIVTFRTNAEGRTYGITFIDNKNKTVFNGSALGKPYSVGAILDRLTSKPDVITAPKPGQRKDNVKARSAAPHNETETQPVFFRNADAGVPDLIGDLLNVEGSTGVSPEVTLQLKRKKKRRKGFRR